MNSIKMMLTGVVGLLSLVGVAQAELQLADLSFANPIIIDGESMPRFTSRVRAEITCDNLVEKLNEYQTTRVQLDQAIRETFQNITNVLYQWDAELYRVMGRPGVQYSGALGRYARSIADYNSKTIEMQNKLQVYMDIFSERMTGCGRN